MTEETIDYYNKNADEYAKRVASADMTDDLNTFLNKLGNIENKKVLEVGAGSGRDLIYMLKNGLNVVPLEPSCELAHIIEKETGVKVINKKVQDIVYEEEFDGVYAMASLLHIPKNEIIDVLKKIKKSMKKEGVFLLTVKQGDGESFDEMRRYFSYYRIDELKELLEEVGFSQVSFNINGDLLNRSDTSWITTTCIKPILELENRSKKRNKP